MKLNRGFFDTLKRPGPIQGAEEPVHLRELIAEATRREMLSLPLVGSHDPFNELTSLGSYQISSIWRRRLSSNVQVLTRSGVRPFALAVRRRLTAHLALQKTSIGWASPTRGVF